MKQLQQQRQKYEISLIPHGLRQEEQILRICESLQQLENITNDVFCRIEKKILEKKEKLESFDRRIEIAKMNIEKIKGNKKATTIFSNPKFPEIPNDSNIISDDVIDSNRKILNSGAIREFNRVNFIANNGDNKSCSDLVLNEPLKKYSVEELLSMKKRNLSIYPYPPSILPSMARIFTSSSSLPTSSSSSSSSSKRVASNVRTKMVDYDADVVGLGPLPSHLESVASLLLFNTADNPYTSPASDPLSQASGKPSKKNQSDEWSMNGKDAPSEAPSTIRGGQDVYRRVPGESINYVPAMGDVPLLVVPEFLPDLSGVADDLLYSSDIGPSIAPSISLSDILLLDLPSVNQLTAGVPDSDLGGVGGSSSSSIPGLPSLPPPPPPPIQSAPTSSTSLPQKAPPTLQQQLQQPPSSSSSSSRLPPPPRSSATPSAAPTATTAATTATTAAVAATPPPPPPPPPPPGFQEVKAPVSSQQQQSHNSSRASLMEAIRGAGGLKGAALKSAKDRKLSDRKIRKNKIDDVMSGGKGSGGGDLMSDLAAKLQLRRKGILGAHGQHRDPLNVLMERIPSIPSKIEQKGDDDDDDGEWD